MARLRRFMAALVAVLVLCSSAGTPAWAHMCGTRLMPQGKTCVCKTGKAGKSGKVGKGRMARNCCKTKPVVKSSAAKGVLHAAAAMPVFAVALTALPVFCQPWAPAVQWQAVARAATPLRGPPPPPIALVRAGGAYLLFGQFLG